MLQPLSKAQRAWSTFIVVAAVLAACLLWQERPTQTFRPDNNGREPASFVNNSSGLADLPPQKHQLSGEQAQQYLEQPGGQSLMKAVTAARFGLKLEERDPISGASGAGYLGMSHDQNLNAWFDETGATIRPTLSKQEQTQAWQLAFRLQAYGYGSRMHAAPPIVAHSVKGARIEYERTDCRLPIAKCRFEEKAMAAFSNSQSPSETFSKTRIATNNLLKSAIGNRQSAITEWYENRAEGIEQGFTINERPARSGEVAVAEPLRVSLGVLGDLHARAKRGEQEIELVSGAGKRVVSYSKLTALDADGKQLAARMEASADGREIVLVVADHDAVYPVVIDPIVVSLEKKLEAFTAQQVDARFGFAVAIDGYRAVVGAWREDSGAGADVGVVYTFTRSDTTWALASRNDAGDNSTDACGWSVAISGERYVYGCPGALAQIGKAYLRVFATGVSSAEIIPSAGSRAFGDQFGYSVAISGNNIVVGQPFRDFSSTSPNIGAAYFFTVDAVGNVSYRRDVPQPVASNDSQFGTAVAVDGNAIVVGAPGALAAYVYAIDPSNPNVVTFQDALYPSDRDAGDSFGESVAISGNTAVVGAYGDDDNDRPNVGAAYVFVRADNGTWRQQQKLRAGDAKADDHFSEHAVAIEGNTIVVGANGWDLNVSGNNAGAAYIFMRKGSSWSLEAEINGDPAENLGISVGISRETVIAGARGSDGSSTPRAGSAYVFLLDCTPPTAGTIYYSRGLLAVERNPTVCADTTGTFFSVDNRHPASTPASFQWRKNGVNIPGAIGETYTITHVSASDAGIYDVFISTSCGNVTSSASTLTVKTISLNPTSQNIAASGSNGVVSVTSTGSCGWTAVSNSSFITITSGASGTATGTVGFTVAANTGLNQRSGTITIASQTFTVNQAGAAPVANVAQFSSSNYGVVEDCTTVTITVNRVGDTSGTASVDYSTSDVSASERRDYITALGRLTFAPGETSKTFAVLINEDSYVEGTETFNVSLSNPLGLSLGAPAIATVTITDDASEPATNVIDAPQTFVCQNYHDFLNRQPDASGLNFWTNEINSCGANQACIELKRINVSAAFFLSIEFQQTGYLVERLYKAAYGNGNDASTLGGAHQLGVPIVRLNEFLSDTQQIGQGVVVGQPGWEQVLENNKQAFIAGFVQRSRFTTAFPNTMTAAQYIDTLNANAGNPLSQSERDQLVSSGMTRAQMLRVVAEDADLVNGESNRAFVLMQFFGYLRRNPNDPPDTDYTGYDFWLTKLNQFNGNFQNAEMVKAFITSGEYRQRFGP